ncbi:TolC family outer membrane protein [Beijerinckia indica]|uniref:Type I secretion outer membrane protein, TolC family n=1 Tax=Beijerinckia indica subsp. indica (strain ATCC 9039 / DSM 1715 / NCIMB 8712) TaxID=395963 RepID=B2ICT1_BEII9|nr:TolC family outer membrane protein [Beijerinckia indica]ACB95355.1 type I secretion outer membrane protein, TolC family [Beijerinckia indica subsp. indica ATCC 9039]
MPHIELRRKAALSSTRGKRDRGSLSSRKLPHYMAGLGLAIGQLLASPSAMAESMSSALAKAYTNNPDMNQERASVRAADEALPQATAGWRPNVSASGSYGYNHLYSHLPTAGTVFSGTYNVDVGQVGVTATQNLFNGNRTLNTVRQAESNILGAREGMRNTEQNILQFGATAYMNVLRDTAILNLRRNNIIVLEEQLRQTRDRFNVGEVTKTDVAQSESSLASARSDYFAAQANLQTNIANYRQIIGVEPKKLEPAATIEKLLPRNVDAAIDLAMAEHPAVQAALHSVDAAQAQVKIAEGALYPKVDFVASTQRVFNNNGIPGYPSFNASVVGQVTVPLYENGGATYSQIRQAKERLGQAQLQADLQRTQVRASVVSSWSQLETAKAVIQSSLAAVKAAEIALNGVREEARVGQRTTLDVLNAQQFLLNTRVSLVTAQRDRVVASYVVMSTVGKLTAANLHLSVVEYDPTVHFEQIKDKWIGVRTPDGR